MKHLERIKAILDGRPIDRPPFVAWGPHFNLEDRHVGDFTKAVIAYQNQHDFDLIKVMQNGLYDVADFGQVIADCENSDDACYMKTLIPAFTCLDDWKNVEKKDVYKGSFGDQMEIIKILSNYYKDDTPVLASIFGPFRMLEQLIGYAPTNPKAYGRKSFVGEGLFPFVHEHESEYFHVMDVLTEQVIDLMSAYLESGAFGFFYCPGGSYIDKLRTDEDYDKYIYPYDKKVLETMYDKTEFIMLHLCGEPVQNFWKMTTLPCHALNWEDTSPTNPSIAEVRATTDKILMGGVDRNHDFYGPDRKKIKAVLKNRVEEVIKEGGPKTIVAVGCESPREITHRFVVWHEVMDEMSINKKA